MTAWLLLAVGTDRQHAGNDGYDDDPARYYSWDSSVPNHARPRVGDEVAVWDKDVLLGSSSIEQICMAAGSKEVHRCRECGRSGIKARASKRPRFYCYQCKAEFERPKTYEVSVIQYRSVHSTGWIDLFGRLQGAELRALCVSPRSQHSIRPIRWGAFQAALAD